jgi:hypothetical protein
MPTHPKFVKTCSTFQAGFAIYSTIKRPSQSDPQCPIPSQTKGGLLMAFFIPWDVPLPLGTCQVH